MSVRNFGLPLATAAILWAFQGAAQDSAAQSKSATAPERIEASLQLKRPERRRIQRHLAAGGFDPGPVDGLFGRGTRNAIRRWQAARGAPATGYLDADAAKALLAAGEPDTEILRDKYILGLSRALKAEKYPKALEFIDKLERTGGDLPLPVYFFRGEALLHTGQYDKAIRAINLYVAKTGKRGRYYRQSLEILLQTEENIEAKKEAEQAAASARAKTKSRAVAEISKLIRLLKRPYSGSGVGRAYGEHRVRFTYRHRVNVKRLSPVSIRLSYSEGKYSSRLRFNSRGHTYRVDFSNVFLDPRDHGGWPPNIRPVVDFTKSFSYGKFGKARCVARPRFGRSSCPSNRPYLLHLRGNPVVHHKSQIEAIARTLNKIRSLMKKAGYPQ